MYDILNDEATYKKLKQDPTKIIQTKNNELIKSWEKKNILPKKLCNELKIHNANPPQIYIHYGNNTKVKYP